MERRILRLRDFRYGQPDADFFDCRAFGKLGEFVEKYLRKGTKVVLDGEIQNNNYTNKDGQKVYGIQIIANQIEFAESKSAQGNAGGDYMPTPNADAGDGFMNIEEDIDDEGIPFAN